MPELVDLIKSVDKIAVFTGAGISTLCGIPDFRGPEGIYRDLDANRLFGLDQFHADPGFYYRHTKDFIYGIQDRSPGLVHEVCANLEAAGRVCGIITQNIDMLHQRAGSQKIIELHGTPATHTCVRCGRQTTFEKVAPVVKADRLPECDQCGAVVKPDITFFGEMLPAGALEAAFSLAAGADLILVLGSSLVVQPAASVPLVTLEAGGRLAIVNLDPTPLDHRAVGRWQDLETEFRILARHFPSCEGKKSS